MPNHKSAQKRCRQTLKRTKINKNLLSKIKTSIKKLNSNILDKKNEDSIESMRIFNSCLSKAVKRGIIKSENASRKLSLLSSYLKVEK